MIGLLVELDRNSDGSFGRLPLKACYRNRLSLFSAQTSEVDMFNKRYAPGNPDEVQVAKYRDAVINMCSVSEEGLAKFISTLLGTDGKDNIPIQKPEGMAPVKGAPHTDVGVCHDAKKSRKRKSNDAAMVGGRTSKKCTKATESRCNDHVQIQETVIEGMDEERAAVAPNTTCAPDLCADPVRIVAPLVQTDVELHSQEPVAGSTPKKTPDALNLLKMYGSGAQASADHPPPSATCKEGILKEQDTKGGKISTPLKCKSLGKIKKTVTFADQGKDSELNSVAQKTSPTVLAA